MQQLLHLEAALVNLGQHLRQAQVVGLAHEEGDEVVEPLVSGEHVVVALQGAGHHHGLLHLLLVVHAEGHGLQPHHAPEVALQGVGAGVVASRTEQAVGELYFLVVHHEAALAVFSLHHLADLLGHHAARLGLADVAAGEEAVGYVVVVGIVPGQPLHELVAASPALHVEGQVVHAA